MSRLPYCLLFSCVLFCSCQLSIQHEPNQITRNSFSAIDIPDVSAEVAAGDFQMIIRDSPLTPPTDSRSESYYGSHPDSIRFKNVPLKQALAALLSLDTLYLKSNKVEALKQRIDLSFKSNRSDSQNRFIVLDGLKKHYHFSVERAQNADWDLVVEDRSRLDKGVVNGTNEYSITTSEWLNNKKLSLEKDKLASLAKGLSKLWDLNISDQTSDSRYFSLNISAEDFTGLQTSLKEHGMTLKKSQISGYPGFIKFEN